MGDLQATVEISVELSSFHNVDLFQRGFYHIRCALKPSEKTCTSVDVEYRRSADERGDDSIFPALVTPSGMTAVSRTFQILFRNEEVEINDAFVFRLHMLVDSNKVTQQVDQTDVQLILELYFSDSEVGPESPESLVGVSSQVLKLHLACVKGVHHHIPVLFDYFHFAIVDTTVHAVLTGLNLPDPRLLNHVIDLQSVKLFPNIMKPVKPSWFGKTPANSRLSTPLLYSKLFGNKPLTNLQNSRTPAEERQIRFAYDTHRSLCSTLLSAQVNLLAYFQCLSEYLPESQRLEIGALDFGERLEALTNGIETIQTANEVFSQICSDLNNISSEACLVWSQFLESFTLNKRVLPFLREEHHRQRIGHFSEAFFLQEFAWDELQIQQEQSYQLHQSLSQGIRNSRYYQAIPPLVVECSALDGDSTSTPILFEDRYSVWPSEDSVSEKADLDEIDVSLDDGNHGYGACGGEVFLDDELVIIDNDFEDCPGFPDGANWYSGEFVPLRDPPLGSQIPPIRETVLLNDSSEDESIDVPNIGTVSKQATGTVAMPEEINLVVNQEEAHVSKLTTGSANHSYQGTTVNGDCNGCESIFDRPNAVINGITLSDSSDSVVTKSCDDSEDGMEGSHSCRDRLLQDSNGVASDLSTRTCVTSVLSNGEVKGQGEQQGASSRPSGLVDLENGISNCNETLIFDSLDVERTELASVSSDKESDVTGNEASSDKHLEVTDKGLESVESVQQETVGSNCDPSTAVGLVPQESASTNVSDTKELVPNDSTGDKDTTREGTITNAINEEVKKISEGGEDAESDEEEGDAVKQEERKETDGQHETNEGAVVETSEKASLAVKTDESLDNETKDGKVAKAEENVNTDTQEGKVAKAEESMNTDTQEGKAAQTEERANTDTKEGKFAQTEESVNTDTKEGKVPKAEDSVNTDTKEGKFAQTEEVVNTDTQEGKVAQTEESVNTDMKEGKVVQGEESVNTDTKEGKFAQTEEVVNTDTQEGKVAQTEESVNTDMKEGKVVQGEESVNTDTKEGKFAQTEEVVNTDTQEGKVAQTEESVNTDMKEGKVVQGEESVNADTQEDLVVQEEENVVDNKNECLGTQSEGLSSENERKVCSQGAESMEKAAPGISEGEKAATRKESTVTFSDITNKTTSPSTAVVTTQQSTTSRDSVNTDSPSDSSVYDTALSSDTTVSTAESQAEMSSAGERLPASKINTKNSSSRGQSAADGTSKKMKKKSQGKGSSSSLGSCLPVNCAGNTSPSFVLSRGASMYGGSVRSRFELAKRFVKRQLHYSCQIYSDLRIDRVMEPYFSCERPDMLESHLIVCVHGLDGNSGDLRLFRCYLEMTLPSSRLDFLMSEVNQPDTFVTFEEMTDRLVQEIRHYIEAYSIFPSKISFVGHSLGNIIIRSALTHPEMRPLIDRLHTLLSLSGPHLGMLYPTSPLVSTGLWLMQKWKKSDALMQLALHDHTDLRQTFLYRLSQSQGLEYFKNILLVSSVQDHYVPYHSARIEMCKAAARDSSEYGTVYREMVTNLLVPLKNKTNTNLIRYSAFHALPSSANSFIGRAAHIAMLDSELFIEKLLLVSALDYFR